MILFAALRRSQQEAEELPTFYVTWEETTIQGAYIQARDAETAIMIARTGQDPVTGELIDVQGKHVNYVKSENYEAMEA